VDRREKKGKEADREGRKREYTVGQPLSITRDQTSLLFIQKLFLMTGRRS